MKQGNNASGETTSIVFRRKIQNSKLFALGLSQSHREVHCTGRLSVVVHDATILKSDYEEDRFTCRDGHRLN